MIKDNDLGKMKRETKHRRATVAMHGRREERRTRKKTDSEMRRKNKATKQQKTDG